jgi:hypothetical protein
MTMRQDLEARLGYSVWSKLKKAEKADLLADLALFSNRDRIERTLLMMAKSNRSPEDKFWALEGAIMEILWNASPQAPSDAELSRDKKLIATAVVEKMGAKPK